MNGDQYRDLATVCRRRKLRLLLCADRDHTQSPYNELSRLEIKQGDEPMVIVNLEHHTLDSAALVALVALEKAGRKKKKGTT